MVSRMYAWVARATAALAIATPALAQTPNKVVGTSRPVLATVDANGQKCPAYGPEPRGQLIFTSDMRYSVVLHDPRIPRFGSDQRGQGTAEENKSAMSGSVALYGSYTVDSEGNFSGNTVAGSTFPNWIGDVRTTEVLSMVVSGNRMTETFQRPGGAKVTIVWERRLPV